MSRSFSFLRPTKALWIAALASVSVLACVVSASEMVTIGPQTRMEAAFSPASGGTELVVKVIASARKSIRLSAYSFTSKPIAQALVEAHRRGVDVCVILDKSQRTERYSSATFLKNSGIPTRIDCRHAICHNKYIIVDEKTVETGSFNYTNAAEKNNAENVLVTWNAPDLARVYLENWTHHWDHAEPYE